MPTAVNDGIKTRYEVVGSEPRSQFGFPASIPTPKLDTEEPRLKHSHPISRLLLASYFVTVAASAALAQTVKESYEPVEGQAGKDVVWVPTPPVLVEKMLDMARVTPRDYVMDLGSGDGRNIIAAAKRGARALGVEWNHDMVELSRRVAAKEGVADRAAFVQGDMYEADVSQATVLALFLLTENLNKMVPKFLEMKPGSRIVVNGFEIDEWKFDETGRAEGECDSWCTAYLYIVPAKVAGTWRLRGGRLVLEQKFQQITGTLTANGTTSPIANGRLHGDTIRFTVSGVEYSGRVTGNRMSGDLKGSATGVWTAKRKTERLRVSQRQ
ncbi:MAG TPA: class I SAM-dependent methyltransferase [Burkholderiales bacterium]|nr:class I SAM-dependent methyltransferase [Burkholderiales bacterium]